MLSISFYIALFGTFFLLLSLALGLTLKTISILFQKPIPRLVLVSVSLTTIVMLLYVYGRANNEVLYRIVLNYMGFANFAFFVALAFWVAALLYRAFYGQALVLSAGISRALGVTYIAAVAVIVGYATYNYHKPEAVVELTMTSKKIAQPVRFAHISDLQYGTTSRTEMIDKMRRVYALDPDFIVFTGDLVDFEGYRTDDFAVLAESPVPIFFERGNHEFYHDPSRLLADLNRVETLRMLINRSDRYGEVDIVGVDFGQRDGHLARQLENIPLDPDRFSILLYHEPIDIPVASRHGFDMMLYGHTHGGQIWPYTWGVDWLYEYADGLYKLGDSLVYTTDGLSLWGPRMRLGSQNEIVIITLLPAG